MLRIAVAGAGITGLVAVLAFTRYGHTVTVYERKTEEMFENEGGAGILLQANAMRILEAWKIDISEVAHETGGTHCRRYATGESVGLVKTVSGSQMYMLRSDFRRAMLAKVLAGEVRVYFGKEIEDVDPSRPALLLKDGVEVETDLIIGADGVRSKVRQALFPSILVHVRQELSFQYQLPFSVLNSDAAKEFANNPNASIIAGSGASIVINPVPLRQILDLQFVQSQYDWDKNANPDRWYEYIPDIKNLRETYHKFGGIIPEVLSLGRGAWKWRHAECSASSWASPNGRVILAGDSCHAMVPYVGHGAGMCIEDAATLAELFRNVSSSDDERFVTLARMYQQLRKPRTDRCRQRSQDLGVSFTLPDGALQRKRDATLRTAMQRKAQLPKSGVPEAHTSSDAFENFLEQYDAIKEAREALRKAGLGDQSSKL